MEAESTGPGEVPEGDGSPEDRNKQSLWQRNGSCNGTKGTGNNGRAGGAASCDRDGSKSSSKRSRSSSSSDSSSEVSLPTPPDGEWGWVVVLASFLVHLIADGCAFSFGVLYVELLDYFGESKGKTAWVGSLFVSVPLMTGPIASAITNRYGCRKATICGGLIAGTGFVLSSFANSIEQLCFTFGIVAGFGLSLVYVPAVVIVAYYFEKRRAFATGIAVAGSGIGTFVFAPLTEYLIEQYSWKGAVLIIGGIMLNICACGAVFRPILDEEEAQRKRTRRRTIDRMSRGVVRSRSSELKELLTKPDALSDLREHHAGPLVSPPSAVDDLVVHSLLQFPTYLQNDVSALPPQFVKAITSGKCTLHDIISDTELMEQCYATQSLTDVACSVDSTRQTGDLENGGVSAAQPSTSADGQMNGKLKANNTDVIWQKQGQNKRGNHLRTRYLYDRLRPMYRNDIFYRGSLMRTCWNYPNAPRAASCPDIAMQTFETTSDDLTMEKTFPLSCMTFSREVKHVINKMLDTSILRSVIFVYFCLSSMLLYMWYDVPYVYTPHKAIGMGISENRASYLVSILGIVSTIGQVCIGFLGDRPHISALHFYNVLTSIAGIATALVPFLPTYPWLCVYACAFGFFISGNYALTTIILVELLGMEKLTNAYGLVMLAEGTANLVGPPLAGILCVKSVL